MPRVKKTRKVTKGTPMPKPKAPSTAQKPNKRAKKSNGKAPGNRNSLMDGKPHSDNSNQKGHSGDRRLGSKKKIPLLSEAKQANENKRLIPKFKSPIDELNYIEADPKLQQLIDKLEDEQKISAEEKHYVDTLLSRHKLLCDLLGIEDDEDTDEQQDDFEVDLLDRLEKPYSDKF